MRTLTVTIGLQWHEIQTWTGTSLTPRLWKLDSLIASSVPPASLFVTVCPVYCGPGPIRAAVYAVRALLDLEFLHNHTY